MAPFEVPAFFLVLALVLQCHWVVNSLLLLYFLNMALVFILDLGLYITLIFLQLSVFCNYILNNNFILFYLVCTKCRWLVLLISYSLLNLIAQNFEFSPYFFIFLYDLLISRRLFYLNERWLTICDSWLLGCWVFDFYIHQVLMVCWFIKRLYLFIFLLYMQILKLDQLLLSRRITRLNFLYIYLTWLDGSLSEILWFFQLILVLFVVKLILPLLVGLSVI